MLRNCLRLLQVFGLRELDCKSASTGMILLVFQDYIRSFHVARTSSWGAILTPVLWLWISNLCQRHLLADLQKFRSSFAKGQQSLNLQFEQTYDTSELSSDSRLLIKGRRGTSTVAQPFGICLWDPTPNSYIQMLKTLPSTPLPQNWW